MHKLTTSQIKHLTHRGLYGDGDGLYLQITQTGVKSWIFRFRVDGKLRNHGLGSINTLNLGEAREAARKCRQLRLQNIDPIEEKKKQKITARLEAAKAMSFKDCAEQYLKAHKAGWKNEKDIKRWANSLISHAYSELGDLPVGQIDSNCVRRAIEPIWEDKNETASRVRGRIEKILDWAKVCGYRTGENPARWKGNLMHLLPARDKIGKVEHLKALPYADMPAFWQSLSKRKTTTAMMLRFTILTAARTGETRFAVWDEIDFDKAMWTIPGERMKMGQDHREPLSAPAVAILKKMIELHKNDFIFPGPKKDSPFSENGMLSVLEQVEYKGKITVHGFRSAFKDWSMEQTDYPNEVSEMALSHAVSNKVEAAYRRGDLLEKRKSLMEDWATYCTRTPKG